MAYQCTGCNAPISGAKKYCQYCGQRQNATARFLSTLVAPISKKTTNRSNHVTVDNHLPDLKQMVSDISKKHNKDKSLSKRLMDKELSGLGDTFVSLAKKFGYFRLAMVATGTLLFYYRFVENRARLSRKEKIIYAAKMILDSFEKKK